VFVSGGCYGEGIEGRNTIYDASIVQNTSGATALPLEGMSSLAVTASPTIVPSPVFSISSPPSVDSGYSASSSNISCKESPTGEDFGTVEEIDQFLDTFDFHLEKDFLGTTPAEGGVKTSLEMEDTDILECSFWEI